MKNAGSSTGIRRLKFENSDCKCLTCGNFIVALIAAVFGFTGIAVAAAGIAKLLFFLFIILFVISLLAHVLAGSEVIAVLGSACLTTTPLTVIPGDAAEDSDRARRDNSRWTGSIALASGIVSN